jgi:hypothetical protein
MRTSLILSLTWLCACGAAVMPQARVAAGRIGCPPEFIELSQLERAGSAPQAWVARCGPRVYACSSNLDPANPNARGVCSPLGGDEREHGGSLLGRR